MAGYHYVDMGFYGAAMFVYVYTVHIISNIHTNMNGAQAGSTKSGWRSCSDGKFKSHFDLGKMGIP